MAKPPIELEVARTNLARASGLIDAALTLYYAGGKLGAAEAARYARESVESAEKNLRNAETSLVFETETSL